MMKKRLAVSGLFMCGMTGWAAIPQDVDWTNVAKDSRFVCLTSNESTSDYNSGDWTTKWSGAKPEAGKWYFTNGKQLFVPSGMTAPFPGDLLVLNSQFRNPGSATWKVNDFVALSGGFIGIRTTKNGGLFVGGDMFVTTSDKPFRIVADNDKRTKDIAQEIELNVTGALTGDETAEIHFGSSQGVYDGATPTSNQFLSVYTLKVTVGDAAHYKGRLTLDDASLTLCSDFGGTVELKNVRLGTELSAEPYPKLTLDGCSKLGGLVVNPCVTLPSSGTMTVDTLTLAPGADFNLDTAGTWKIGKIVGKGGRLVFSRTQGSSAPLAGELEITGGFDAETCITIANTAAAWTSATPKTETRIALLRIAASVDPAGVSLDRFRLERAERTSGQTDYGCFPIQDLELQENADGSRTLYLVGREVVTVVSGAGAFTYAGSDEKWSDGRMPHADKDYFIAYTDSPTTVEFTEDTVFPGPNALVRNATLKIHADVTIPNLVLARTAQVAVSSKTDRLNRLSGRIGIYGEATETYPSSHTTVFTASETSKKDPYVLEVAADLYGPGVLQLRNNGIVRLTGDNSAFTGRMIWYLDAAKPESNQSILEIDNATSLGGELPAFDPAAIAIANNGTIRALKTLSLASETRGIRIQGPSVFEAPEGVTFAISNQIDYASVLTKKGSGVLALGGTPTVGADGRLDIAEGTLKPISGSAFRGLSVSFATGTVMLFDPAVTPDGVEVGSLASEGQRVTVRLAREDDGQYHHETVPLFVAPTFERAQELAGRLSVKCPYARHAVTLSVVPTEDGRGKVVAEIQPSGLVIILR